MPDVEVVCGDAYDVVRSLPENSVDLILTSPPYFGLRTYGAPAVRVWGGDPTCSHRWEGGTGEAEVRGQFCPACGAWRGQLGLEPSVGMYVEHLRDFFRLCLRVLKPWGNLALNLGDTFARSPAKGGSGPGSKERAYAGGNLAVVRKGKRDSGKWCRLSDQAAQCGFPEKMKLGIPWRVRFALNDDGWVSRDDIVWEKPNSMPSSAGSRLTTTYEMVFRFVRDVRPGPYCRLRSSALLNAPDVAAEFGRRCATWGSVGILPREMCEPGWAPHLVRLDAYFDLDAVRLPLAESSVRRALQATLERQRGGPKAAGYSEAVMHQQKRAIPNLLRSLKAKVSREQ
ncbi:MAG: DNA methyltransferase, partial [Bacillota bacterium]